MNSLKDDKWCVLHIRLINEQKKNRKAYMKPRLPFWTHVNDTSEELCQCWDRGDNIAFTLQKIRSKWMVATSGIQDAHFTIYVSSQL